MSKRLENSASFLWLPIDKASLGCSLTALRYTQQLSCSPAGIVWGATLSLEKAAERTGAALCRWTAHHIQYHALRRLRR